MLRRAACAAAVAGALLLAACTADIDTDVLEATPESGTQQTDAGREREVPAPGGGTVDDVVDDVEPAPVVDASIDEPVDLDDGARVRIDSIRPVDVVAQTPGEISGPAVAVELTVVNDGEADIPVDTAMVSLVAGDGAMGQPTTAEPSRPLAGSVGVGGEASGVYVFLLPEGSRSGYAVTFQYLAGTTVASFAAES